MITQKPLVACGVLIPEEAKIVKKGKEGKTFYSFTSNNKKVLVEKGAEENRHDLHVSVLETSLEVVVTISKTSNKFLVSIVDDKKMLLKTKNARLLSKTVEDDMTYLCYVVDLSSTLILI